MVISETATPLNLAHHLPAWSTSVSGALRTPQRHHPRPTTPPVRWGESATTWSRGEGSAPVAGNPLGHPVVVTEPLVMPLVGRPTPDQRPLERDRGCPVGTGLCPPMWQVSGAGTGC